MTRALLFSVLLAACTNTPQISVPVEVSTEALKLMISGYEDAVTPEQLASLEGDVPAALMKLATDPNEKNFYAARAYGALVHYPEERVFAFFEKTLTQKEPLSVFVLPTVLRSFDEAFSTSKPEQVVNILASYGAHESPVIRESVVVALSKIPVPKAQTILREIAQRETELGVQTALQNAKILP
jgi:hypothetical protein